MYRDLSITTRLVGEPPHRQVAVGALLCARKHAATLRKLLPRAWCGTAITNYDPSANTEPWGPSGKPHRFASGRQTEQLAVHLSSVGAAELCKWQTEGATGPQSHKGIPPALQAQLDNGTCTFVAGLRVGGAPMQIIDSRSLANKTLTRVRCRSGMPRPVWKSLPSSPQGAPGLQGGDRRCHGARGA